MRSRTLTCYGDRRFRSLITSVAIARDAARLSHVSRAQEKISMTTIRPGATKLRVCAALLFASFVCLVTAGCASRSSSNAEVAVPKSAGSGGYVPTRRYETIATQDTWTVNGNQVDVTLLVPAPPGPYPLVLYVPGLGEPSDAGVVWRQAWARAGYAVLGVQPTQFGPAIWSSSRARAGDFSGIARDAFAVKSLAARAQILRDTFEYVSRRQRGAAGTQRLQPHRRRRLRSRREDRSVRSRRERAWCRGSALPRRSERRHRAEPLCRSCQRRKQLSVDPSSGPGDHERSGRRHVSVDCLPIDAAYAVRIHAAGTQVSAGTVERGPWRAVRLRPVGPRDSKDAEDTFTADDDKILGDETAEILEGPRKRRRRPDYSAARADRLAQIGRVQGQVQTVTTAYLDVVVRNDAAAAQWLDRNAKAWLGNSAELVTK